ncbi:MAG: hypothetical protein DCF15_19410, partial [Phormidesmis priestleyi]
RFRQMFAKDGLVYWRQHIFWEGTKFPSYSFALLFSQLLAIYDIEVPCHPVRERPQKGFNQHAERLNGRAAMIGIAALILIQLLTGKGLLTLLGLT